MGTWLTRPCLAWTVEAGEDDGSGDDDGAQGDDAARGAAAQSALDRKLPVWLVHSVRRNGWLEDWRLAAALVVLGLAVAVGWALLVLRDRQLGRRRRHPICAGPRSRA